MAALISGRVKSTDISMPRSTRKKWAAILEAQGRVRRYIEGGAHFYELTRKGVHYAILEHGLRPAPAEDILPPVDGEEPPMVFARPTRLRSRWWVAVGKLLILIALVGICGYTLGRYNLAEGALTWLHSMFSAIR